MQFLSTSFANKNAVTFTTRTPSFQLQHRCQNVAFCCCNWNTHTYSEKVERRILRVFANLIHILFAEKKCIYYLRELRFYCDYISRSIIYLNIEMGCIFRGFHIENIESKEHKITECFSGLTFIRFLFR